MKKCKTTENSSPLYQTYIDTPLTFWNLQVDHHTEGKLLIHGLKYSKDD